MREPKQSEALLQWLHGTVVGSVQQGYDDLTMRQLAVMLITYMDGDLQTVRGLAGALGISRPAVSRALDRLGDFGLTRRQVDPRDRRSIVVRRTRKGTERMQQLRILMKGATQSEVSLPSLVIAKAKSGSTAAESRRRAAQPA